MGNEYDVLEDGTEKWIEVLDRSFYNNKIYRKYYNFLK